MSVDPSREQLSQLAALAAEAPDTPVVMLNLNRYRDRAAYERYGEAALPVLARVGARILWYTQAKQTVIGDESDRFDEVIAVQYPNAGAFLTFATDPEIVAALEHRRAGLEHAVIICCEPGTEPVAPAAEPVI
jgi:uncharacterized protein (DUF1330 family)